MFKNYFYLNRAVLELQEHLNGAKVFEIYTQEKDTLYFHIPTEENENQHLVVSINQNEPYLILKVEHHKARKNVAHFYSDQLPLTINSMEIAERDRIIKLVSESVQIIITFRGTLSNIILVSENEKEFFKKVKRMEENGLLNELQQNKFTSKFNLPSFDEDIKSLTELKKKYTYLTKDILNEVKSRTSTEDFGKQKEILKKVISQIKTDPIQIYYTNDLHRYTFAPSGYITLTRDSEVFEYDNYQDALIKLLSLGNKLSREQKLHKEISKYLEKELGGLSQKLDSLKQRVDIGSREDEYRSYGDLLISNLHQIKKGMKSIVLNDFKTGDEVKIKLDGKISAKQNVDYYYDKARGEKISYEKSKQLFSDAEKKYKKLIDIKVEFENTDELTKLKSIKEKLELKDKKQVETNIPQMKFRHFIIENKYHVFVGRDSKSNDQLSIKFAKQNDYWFHARGYAGSHVVLRVDNPKEGIPKNILKDAASIAAYYSKAKTAGTAPVAYTFAKYVTKRKGMEPGKVMLQKESVLLVRPEIPKSAEQVED